MTIVIHHLKNFNNYVFYLLSYLLIVLLKFINRDNSVIIVVKILDEVAPALIFLSNNVQLLQYFLESASGQSTHGI